MTMETAIVVASVALASAVVTAVTTYHRSLLEERRIKHEEQKWFLELHAGLEKRLHEIRLEEYPPILKELERLSHFCINQETPESIRDLARKLNMWGYGRSGLCMSSRTRDSLFILRKSLGGFADGRLSSEDLMKGPRTDLIEWLRRDLNHSVSTWRELPSLLSELQQVVKAKFQ